MEKVDFWGIVDLFGHQKVAGKITEAAIGGCSFVRVDVPEMEGNPAVTHFYGQGAIYSMTPVSEDLVKAFLKQYRPEPISIYIPELRQIEARPEDEEGD